MSDSIVYQIQKWSLSLFLTGIYDKLYTIILFVRLRICQAAAKEETNNCKKGDHRPILQERKKNGIDDGDDDDDDDDHDDDHDDDDDANTW